MLSRLLSRQSAVVDESREGYLQVPSNPIPKYETLCEPDRLPGSSAAALLVV